MKAGTRMALGVAAGYLLGRTKKMRLALMIAAAGATGKAGVSPAKLVQSGLKQLGSSEELGQLTSLARDELLTAAKSAAVTAASGRIESLTERLQDGGSLTRGKKSRGKADEDESAEEPEDAEIVDEEEDEKPRRRKAADTDDEDEAAERPKRRRPAKRTADDDSAERPPRRRSTRRAAASNEDEDEDEGSGGTRTATRRSPVRRARR